MWRQFFLLPLFLPLSGLSQNKMPAKINIDKAAYKILKAGIKPDFLTIDGEAVWVINDHQSKVIKLELSRDTPSLVVAVPEACTAPVIGFNALWVMSCTEKRLYKIDKNTGVILAKIATGMADEKGEMSLAIAAGSVWLLSDSIGILLRIDPVTNTIKNRIIVEPNSYCAAASGKAIWVSNFKNNSIQKIDTKTNKVVGTIAVGKQPRFIAATNRWVFTLNQGDGTVTKIDAVNGKVVASINVHAIGGGGDIDAYGQRVWVKSTNPDLPLQTINISTNKIETIYEEVYNDSKPIKVDGAVRVSKKYIWVTGYFNNVVWILKNK